MHHILYLFEYNAQNCIPKTPTQSSVHIINKVLDFYAFTPEGTWVQVRIINKSYAREHASTVYLVLVMVVVALFIGAALLFF